MIVGCSWCHAAVDLRTGLARPFCPCCGHRADVPRAACDCPKCWKPDDVVVVAADLTATLPPNTLTLGTPVAMLSGVWDDARRSALEQLVEDHLAAGVRVDDAVIDAVIAMHGLRIKVDE